MNQEIELKLINRGAELIRFVDISHLSEMQNRQFPHAIVFALPLTAGYIKEVCDTPNYVQDRIADNFNFDDDELVKFYLSSSIGGKGVGSRLLLLTEEQAKEAGYKQLYIETFPCFRATVHLYDKMGFTNLDARMGNSGHTATTIHMVKDI